MASDDSDSDVDEILIFTYLHTYYRRRLGQRRAIWIHDTIRKRRQLGEYHRLVSELLRDSFRFQNVLSYVTYCIRSTTSTSGTHHSED